ncbi:hypothetical protein [Salinisphaera hydrothermalis]|uniref:Uncharacterized protein n=1 Tax=Salinisphaera hydrothermalis (strain C41B8) TaxID=1304275 RepID=A0A084INM8_SALHC|nr:hypothetical protein [Salinisphaera hydrothermalis]KEZ78312.1 hypothetical protein C41B8_05403 [Salinisphaera hydrothermalis C41B8]
MSRHTISYADQLFHGKAVHHGAYRSQRGVPMTPVVQVDLGVPAATDGDGIATDQTPAAGGVQMLTLDGQLNLDVPRNVTITSTGDDSGRAFTVRGRDQYGHAMSETIAGANAGKAEGAKAFAVVESVTVDDDTADAVSVGWATVLGLPFRIGGAFDVLHAFTDDTEEVGTVVGGDDAPATATTGDVRGTIDPGSAPDGSRHYRVWLKIHDASSEAGAYGVEQA